MDNEFTLHNFIILAICVSKIIKFGGDLMKFWQKQFVVFFWPTLYILFIQTYRRKAAGTKKNRNKNISGQK